MLSGSVMERTGGHSFADAPRPAHLPFVDGLRGLAAAFVVAHHCWFEVYPDAMNHRPAGRAARVVAPLAVGHWAVAVFILLSGFCLYRPVAARRDAALAGGALDFYRRRARRILPPYFAALAVSLGLILTLVGSRNGCHWDVALADHGGVSGRGLLAAACLAGDALGSYQVNHSFWSVQVECKIYLLFPLLVWAARRFGPWAMAATVAPLAFAAASAGHHFAATRGAADGMNVQFVGLFAAGMVAAAASARRPVLPAWAGPATVAIATVAVAAAVWHLGLIRAIHASRCLDAGVMLVVAPALVWLARHPAAAATRTLSARPLTWLGGISFSLYLLHAPLVQVAYRYAVAPLGLRPSGQLAALVVASAVLAVAAAVPFHRWVERPSQRPRRRTPERPAVLGRIGPATAPARRAA